MSTERPTIEFIEGGFYGQDDLYIELTNGKLPPDLMVKHPTMFMVEHAEPGRVMLNLTAYIKLIASEKA